MSPRRVPSRARAHRGARTGLHVSAGAAALLGLVGTPAESAPRFGVGVTGGALGLDGDLDNYQWDVTPRPVLGVITRVSFGRAGAGLRVREWDTQQSTGSSESVEVRGVALETTGRYHAASVLGTRLLATGGIGGLFLGYEPETVTLNVNPAAPVTVTFAPITTWLFALGLGLERPLGTHLVAGAEMERDFFSLDATHRSGTSLVTERENFGAWNLRLTLTWEWGG